MSAEFHIDDELELKAYDWGLMKRLLKYMAPYRRMMIAAACLLVIFTVLGILTPFLTMHAIDNYLSDAGQEAPLAGNEAAQTDAAAQSNATGLARLAALMLGLTFIEATLRYTQMVIVAIVGQKTLLAMRMQIFGHLQKMALGFLDKNPVGRLMTRVTNDVENIQETIVTGLVQAFGEILSIFCTVAFMFWLNWRLTLYALGTIPLIFIVSLIFRRYVRDSFLEVRKKIAAVNAYMQETVSGMGVVQMFGHEDRAYRRYSDLNAAHRDEWFRQIRYFAIYFPTVDFLGSFSVALVIFIGGRQILQGQDLAASATSVGMIYAFMQYTERLFWPIRSLADRYNLLQAAMASSERIFQLLDTPEGVPNKPDAIPCDEPKGAVAFNNVSFAYEGDKWIIKNINFHVEPGERVAIVGHTGAGKTTAVSLLSRFYDVQEGSITVDGIDVRDYEKTSLRRNIGVVLQDVFLFSGTVDFNIRLGDETMTDEHVRACAEYVNAARFIDRLPGGYDYEVGERGCNLSTGQRQLLAFARTLAHDPRILILDEATSSVDTETEALIQDAIGKLLEGRTSIVIAHRLSTVQHADRIIVLHHGEIREMGTHQELLARRGLYYTLYQLQYKDQSSAPLTPGTEGPNAGEATV